MHGSSWESRLGNMILRLRNRYFFLWDIIIIPFVSYLAFVLRLETFELGEFQSVAIEYAILSLVIKTVTFYILGGYRHYWPFASMPEMEIILSASVLSEFLAFGAEAILSRLLGFRQMPRSIPFISLILTMTAFATPRLGVRWLYSYLNSRGGCNKSEKRVLIVGAGNAGYMALREIYRNPQLGILPVGFIDDDESKQNLRIQETRILGRVADIPHIVREYHIEQVLIAIPTATSEQMCRIVDMCHETDTDVLTLPGVFELISGEVKIQRFRPVKVEDLLARKPVQTDMRPVEDLLSGKVVLVSGAGGSIGSELCRQIALRRPSTLVLLGHGENSIYHIHKELLATYPGLNTQTVIADTRDAARIRRIFMKYRPSVVFHAAAHKHVPLMELNPEEAVTNNVGGTRALVQAAEAAGTDDFVMISSDKAVNPTSVMGVTKRIAEFVIRDAAQRTGRSFEVVRFGNVLGSRGSVVPLFQKQIEAGGPVTVTHPDIERYFMTIPEAVQLVLQAATLGKGGEVFVLNMGEPVKIVDLAREMIRLAGREGEVDISFTGLRPGEKLYEELFLSEENSVPTAHDKIFVSQNGRHDYAQINQAIDTLLASAHAGDTENMFRQIRELVPETTIQTDK